MLRQNKYFAVQETSDENGRIFHSRIQLMDGYSVQGVAKNAQHADLGIEVKPITKIILDIPGVTFVEVKANQVYVQKSPCFTWDEIEDRLLGDLWYGLAQTVDVIEQFENFCSVDGGLNVLINTLQGSPLDK